MMPALITLRETFALRGRIVSTIASAAPLPSGSPESAHMSRSDRLFQAMADAGDFNRAHPEYAIPVPMRVSGLHLPACAHCLGEGSTCESEDYTPPQERICRFCRGSGFAGLRGYGDDATGALV
jgi:hypothetical protein